MVTAQMLAAGVAARLLTETLRPLADQARRLPCRHGRPPHPATLLRWIQRGVRGRAGERVILEGVRVGSTWYTSDEAIGRFLVALSSCPNDPAVARSSAERQRATERALVELDALGV